VRFCVKLAVSCPTYSSSSLSNFQMSASMLMQPASRAL